MYMVAVLVYGSCLMYMVAVLCIW